MIRLFPRTNFVILWLNVIVLGQRALSFGNVHRYWGSWGTVRENRDFLEIGRFVCIELRLSSKISNDNSNVSGSAPPVSSWKRQAATFSCVPSWGRVRVRESIGNQLKEQGIFSQWSLTVPSARGYSGMTYSGRIPWELVRGDSGQKFLGRLGGGLCRYYIYKIKQKWLTYFCCQPYLLKTSSSETTRLSWISEV